MKKSTIPLFSSLQMILVVSDSATATMGTLHSYERDAKNGEWKQSNQPIAVALGRSGLGAGLGIHQPADLKNLPPKKEGDGRSPAGIFTLGSVFGYAPVDKMAGLKMPYLPITEMTECVDDVKSNFYNQIVAKDIVAKSNQVDWDSAEKMSTVGVYYELGIVVNHNQNPVNNGCGSCIFLHNWAIPITPTSGCTSMAPENMALIAYWLNAKQNPVLVQLTKQLYSDLKTKWKLPEL